MNLDTTNDGLSSLGIFIKDNSKILGKINDYSFENFLRIYKNKDQQFFYNILSNTVFINEELDPITFYEVRVQTAVPWTTLSYNEYRTMHLWWLIMEVNKIRNPLDYPKPGTVLKILYPQYVKFVVDAIHKKIQGI